MFVFVITMDGIYYDWWNVPHINGVSCYKYRMWAVQRIVICGYDHIM